MCRQFSKKILVLILFVFQCFFKKCAVTSVHKNPKIYVNIRYFANRGHFFFLIKLICLAENSKAGA